MILKIEVTLILNEIEVTCFTSVCSFKIYERKEYQVSFEFMIFGDYSVETSDDEIPTLERINNSFSYWITGKLNGSTIDFGIQFEDEILLSDYGYLDGKYIRLKADRIDVEFLEEE